MYEIKKNGCQNSIKKNTNQTSTWLAHGLNFSQRKSFYLAPSIILVLPYTPKICDSVDNIDTQGASLDVEGSDLNLHSFSKLILSNFYTKGFKNRREPSSKNIQSVTFWKSLFQPSPVEKYFLLVGNQQSPYLWKFSQRVLIN